MVKLKQMRAYIDHLEVKYRTGNRTDTPKDIDEAYDFLFEKFK